MKLASILLWLAACASMVFASDQDTKNADKAAGQQAVSDLLAGRFKWQISNILVSPINRPEDSCHAIKDPTIVRHQNRWHLFCTIRSEKRSHQIEYLSFADWNEADRAPRHILTINDAYFCAPQVFYFAGHKKWYLIHQMIDESRKPALQPAFSTTYDISDPRSWTKPALMFAKHPEQVKRWIDFWVICDRQHAYLFFTSLNGRMWRAKTKLEDFPHRWSKPEIVLQGDIFEASHIYRIKGMNKYLAVIEANDHGLRYHKAYLADRLDGDWTPLADSKEKPFAGPANVRDSDQHWTDMISHGELIRCNDDQTPEIDPANLQFLFQGTTQEKRKGKKYGEIPWRLGLLRPAR